MARTMTDKQRKAAIERLAAARAAKGHDGSATVHPDLHDADPDSPLHWRKVRTWIKDLSIELKSKKVWRDSKDAKQRLSYLDLETYIGNLKKYLSTGVYHDRRYGRTQEGKIINVVHTLAYHPDGFVKRTIGYYYKDLEAVWTREMDEEYNKLRGRECGISCVHDEEELHEVS